MKLGTGLPLDDGGTPGEACSEDNHQHEVTATDTLGTNGFIESDGDTGSARVSIFLYINEHLILRRTEAFSDGGNNPQIRLMRDDTADLANGQTATIESLRGSGHHGIDGVLKGFLAVHPQEMHAFLEAFQRSWASTPAAGHVEERRLGAVGSETRGQESVSRWAVLDDGGTGTIAEEHACVAILPVDDARHFLGPDNENGVVGMGLDEVRGDVEGIDEAGAGGFDVKGGGPAGSEFLLNEAGRAREEHIGRDGGDDDELDLVRGDFRVLKGPFGGQQGEIGGGLVGRGNPSLLNSGAGGDPLTGGTHHFLQILIGQNPSWEVRADSCDGHRAQMRPAGPGMFHRWH